MSHVALNIAKMTSTSPIVSTAIAAANNSNTNAFNDGVNNTNTIEVECEQTHIRKELNGTDNTNTNTHNNDNIGKSNSGANNLRGADFGKRKKLKSRNIPTTPTTSYSKDHLDAWLETCLKDVSQEQLSSSSEFLDYNPTTTGINVAGKQKQQQHMANVPSTNLNVQQQQHFMQHPAPQQQHQQGMSQTPFMNTRSNAKGNSFMSGFPNSYTTTFSQGFQRSMPNFMKPTNSRFSTMFSPSTSNFYGQMNDGSQDFASLPPIVNLLGNYGGNNGTGNGAGSSEHENNSTDVLDGSGSNPNISRGFRFSDPCLLNPSDNDSKVSGQNTPDRRQNIPSEMENNKFFVALMEQISLLHETNSKICRNLHETKVDIEALKHAPTWGMRHRRDSLSGLSAHSQPMIFGGGFGTQSPAPTYHSGAYTPGMMTDVVREVKEAARVREDALLNRVKALVEERQWTMNETNLRIMRDIEELKTQLNFLRSDRKEANKRITHLEAENKYMRQLLASVYNSNRNQPSTGRSVIYENEPQRARKSLPNSQHTQARRAHSLNLHYGTVHHQASSSLSLEEQDEEPLHIIEPSTMPQTDFAERRNQQQQKLQQQQQQPTFEMRNSFSSSDGSNGMGAENVNQTKLAMSPPKFALISTPIEQQQQPSQQSQQPLQKPKRKNKENTLKKLSSEESLQQQRRQSSESVKTLSTQELQKELNEAVVARQNADERIIAIEKLVRNLHVNATHPTDTVGVGDDGVGVYNNLITTTGHSVNQSNAITTTSSKTHMHHYLRNHQQPIAINVSNSSSMQPSSAGNKQHHYQSVSSGGNNNNSNATILHTSPKLSVAGPITDL